MSNPYTLVFGQPPLEFIERKAQADRIINEFCQERPSNYLNLVIFLCVPVWTVPTWWTTIQ